MVKSIIVYEWIDDATDFWIRWISLRSIPQVTIPASHSSVALLKLAQLPYNGATSLFIRVLLNKKYALAYKVCHLSRFAMDCTSITLKVGDGRN